MSKKFSPMRFTAATEEAAIEGAMQLVGATRDEISYDFISQTAKGITIRIRPFEEEAKTPEPELVAEAEPEIEEDEAAAPLHLDSMHDYDESNDNDLDDVAAIADEAEIDEMDAEQEETEESETSDDELDFDANMELADDEYDSNEEDDSDDEGDSDDEADDDLNETDSEPEIESEVEIDSAMSERALTLARAMLDKMGLDAQVSGGRATVIDVLPLIIEGEDVGILIGKHGATLQSFQYLMNLTLNNHSEGALRVAVDAGNYRARRQESLEAVARGTASRVRRENRPIKMEPMPSSERRIVHDFLKNEAGVSTQSEGREPHRCVIIAPAESDYRSASNDHRSRRGMGGYGRGGRGGRDRR